MGMDNCLKWFLPSRSFITAPRLTRFPVKTKPQSEKQSGQQPENGTDEPFTENWHNAKYVWYTCIGMFTSNGEVVYAGNCYLVPCIFLLPIAKLSYVLRNNAIFYAACPDLSS